MARSTAPLLFSSRSENHLSKCTRNSFRSLRMSASMASRANRTMESNSAAPSRRCAFSMRPSMCLSLSPMTHVHGSSGIGRHELDHDLPAGAEIASAVGVPPDSHITQLGEPRVGSKTEVDEAGAGELGLGNQLARR